MRRCFTLMGVAALTLVLGASPAGADFSDSWTDGYGALLRRYVGPGTVSGKTVTLVDYRGLREDAQFARLRRGLARLPAFPDLPEKKRLALWTNIYNFLVIDRVVRNPGLKSLVDLNGAGVSVWHQPAGMVAGRVHSLDGIERKVLQKQFREPRLHFVLTKAALGSPDLRAEAYRAEKLDEQFRAQMETFLNNPNKGSRIEKAPPVLFLSELFFWFKADFGGDPRKWLLEHRLLPPDAAQSRLSYTNFDLRLNAQPGRN